jgi:HlyD family secretion protein
MNRRILVPAIIAVVGFGGLGGWWLVERQSPANELVLYGNVDLRQVDLAFNDSGRIAEVLVEEGDHVEKDQVLARLDTSRLEPQVARAEAEVSAQLAVVERLHNGSRPEEIAQARANLEAAEAEALNARQQFDRKSALGGRSVVSQQDVDAAKAAMDTADAKVEAARKTLDLVIAGPRAEEIAQAEAQLRASEAGLALLREQLADADLTAPVTSVVRSRLMEPGEIASPQQPVFSLAVVSPKWVRAYVSEPDLAKLRPGMPADVAVDGMPGKRFPGTIGFISPVAEFTPKAVQTEELRTSLVYEVRVNVTDKDDNLRLGMPATVYPKLGLDSEQEEGGEPMASLAGDLRQGMP